MKLKEAINIALTYLGYGDASLCAGAEDFPETALLIRCANIVIKEIASDYLPLTETETAEVKDCGICFDALKRRASDVIFVADADSGIKMQYSCSPTHIIISDPKIKSATVKYRYIPADIGADGDCPIFPSVGAKTLAMGICAEYALIEGAYEKSVMFADRFKEDMRAAARKKGEIKIKPRRWK